MFVHFRIDFFFFFLPCLIVHLKKKITVIPSKHFNQPNCCLSSAPDLEWDHMWSSCWAQQSLNICAKCVFFSFELTRHMETSSGWTKVTTSLPEPLIGRTSRCAASQESLSVNDAISWSPGVSSYNYTGAIRGTFSAKPRNPLDGGSH